MRDTIGLGGCAVVLFVFVMLFAMSAMAQRDGDYQRARMLFATSGIVLVVGVLAVAGYYAFGIWRQGKEIELGRQALIDRADKLRRERERRRESTARGAATQSPPATKAAAPATSAKAQATASAASPASGAVYAKPRGVRAARNLSTCPLCQTKILAGEKYVACPACSASYHEDCWEYNGGCAVFGCAAKT